MIKRIEKAMSNPVTKKTTHTIFVCVGILIFINGLLSLLNARREKKEAMMKTPEFYKDELGVNRVKNGVQE